MTYSDASVTPIENVPRGTIFALAIIPVGVLAWVLVWSIGFVASIIAFGIAYGAFWLYKTGAGTMSRTGAIRVAIITFATLIVAFWAGLVVDVVRGLAEGSGLNWIEVLTHPDFWPTFNYVYAQPGVIGDLVPSILIALALGALGTFRILKNAFAATSPAALAAARLAQEQAAAQAAVAPTAPVQQPGQPPQFAFGPDGSPVTPDAPVAPTAPTDAAAPAPAPAPRPEA